MLTALSIAILVAGTGFSVWSYYDSKRQSEAMFVNSQHQAQQQMEAVRADSVAAEGRALNQQLEAEARIAASQRFEERARKAATFGRDYRGSGSLRKD